jgi:hypothetical protein
MKVTMPAITLPASAGLVWKLGPAGGVGWWIFLVLLGIIGGWLWSALMWIVCKADLQRIASELPD